MIISENARAEKHCKALVTILKKKIPASAQPLAGEAGNLISV
jgi:hypothetical protein